MNKKGKETIAGVILSSIVIIILLFVFHAVKEELQKTSPEINETLEEIGENVDSAVNWYFVVGGIVGLLGLIAWVLWWLKDNDII